MDLEKLTLTTQPYRTLKLFVLATLQYLKQSLLFLLRKGGWFMLLSILAVSLVTFLIAVDGPQEKVLIIPFVDVNSPFISSYMVFCKARCDIISFIDLNDTIIISQL